MIFDVSNMGRVQWQRTKRLMYGSLVCLTPDNLNTLIMGTVSDGDWKCREKGRMKITLLDTYPYLRAAYMYTQRQFIMIEPSAFYEAYRHILGCLQDMRAGLPFQAYLLYCLTEIIPPRHLRDEDVYDLRAVVDRNCIPKTKNDLASRGSTSQLILQVKVDVESRSREAEALRLVRIRGNSHWPGPAAFLLDSSQHTALRAALRHELVLIQGPPGTGKTFLGLKIVKSLIHNKGAWMRGGASPILVVCYTNHALDQFLEGIAQFIDGGIVRVGGRCQTESLQRFALKELRQKYKQILGLGRDKFECHSAMTGIKNSIDLIEIEMRQSGDGVSSFKFLQKLMYDPRYRGQFNTFFYHTEFDLVEVWNDQKKFFYWLGLTERRINKGKQGKGKDKKATGTPKGGKVQMVPYPMAREDIDSEEDGLKDIDSELDYPGQQPTAEPDHGDEERAFKEHQKSAQGNNLAQAQFEYYSGQQFGSNFRFELKAHWYKTLKEELKKLDFMSEDEVDRVWNIWELPEGDRWRLYRHWLVKYKEDLFQEIHNKEQEHARIVQRLKGLLDTEDRHIMRQATVLGMTTTGAAKNRHLLQQIQPRIVIVEEAAEVLEAHIITALSPGCEHLILIGDHQQLRPNPADYKLAKKYNLEISLFERLITNGLPSTVLEKQHRMRPEISRLLKHIYPHLRDDESVLKYDNIQGVSKNTFFINHHEPETGDDELRSKSNKHEAEYITALCRYFLLQDYNPSQITVLVAYTGQLFLAKNHMSLPEFEGVKVTPVDNYQGEENDIIILSLVRSNNNNSIGFLKEDNRVCVALSRAKKGFYAIGNFDLYQKVNPLWAKMVSTLGEDGAIGDGLDLMCTNHPDVVTHATTAADFENAPQGGCKRPCEARLDCGHVCRLVCHATDRDHKRYLCFKPCQLSCESGHKCKKDCYLPCGLCMVRVEKVIPKCQHAQMVPCHLSPDEFTCQKPCAHILGCGHQCSNTCGERHTVKCQHPCEKTCDSGHPCRALCHQRCPPCVAKVEKELSRCGHTQLTECHIQETQVKCHHPCDKLLACRHLCPNECGENHATKCIDLVGKNLPCGHTTVVHCHRRDEAVKCQVSCEDVLLCGHDVVRPCFQKPRNIKCQLFVDKKAQCGHTMRVQCHSDLREKDKYPCKFIIEKQLKCGHTFKSSCHKMPKKIDCKEAVQKKLPCGHSMIMACFENPRKITCEMKVNKFPPCGHNQVAPCHVKEKDIKCEVKVKRKPSCGHEASVPCHIRDDNIECQETIRKTLKCGHNLMLKCHVDVSGMICQLKQKKILKCGHKLRMLCHENPATAKCSRPCGRRLSCGHPCTGHCGGCKTGKHQPCTQPQCPRLLLCGHPCQGRCKDPCPPCKVRCMRRCPHSMCGAPCGQVCKPCHQPCVWNCPHHHCTRECHESCDRPRCDEPCPHLLRCRHPCVGLCGEPCPYLCRDCHKDVLKAKLKGGDLSSARFVLLEDCGHIIEVSVMDELVDSGMDATRMVALKSCPECHRPLLKSNRYGNVIKKILAQLEEIKGLAYSPVHVTIDKYRSIC